MKTSKITFKKNNKNDEDEFVYKPDARIDTYYQICRYKNELTNKYNTRKIFFNEHGIILKIFENEHSLKSLEKFMKQHSSTKFKIFSTNDIKLVDLPNKADMLYVRSELLN
jgi:hypothetical protein